MIKEDDIKINKYWFYGILGFVVFGIFILCVVLNIFTSPINLPDVDVKQLNKNIQNLQKIRSEELKEVAKIDSTKNEKVEEVKHYSNDSTLELFKELVSE